MITDLLFPTFFIIILLSSSAASSFIICKLFNRSFFNTELYTKSYLYEKIKMSLIVSIQTIIFYNIIYTILSKYSLDYTHTNTPIQMVQRMHQNIMYVLLLELFNYIYHRLSHKIQLLYQYGHSIHHKNIKLYPIDFLEFDISDVASFVLYANLPLYFVRMYFIDYFIINYIYTVYGFLIHCDLITTDHIIHHKYFKYNFYLMIPIYDIIFQTYKNKKNLI